MSMFHITKQMAERGHYVKMVAFGNEEPTSLAGLRRYCELSIVKQNTNRLWPRAIFNVMSNIPYTISKYHTDSMFSALREIVEHLPFDIVHIDHLHMAVYGVFLKERYGLPIVLREHNLESTIMERFARTQKNLLLRGYATLQHRKLRVYEPDMCAKFDRCVMITAEDEERMRAMSNQIRTTVIPAGFDLPVTPEVVPEKPKSILFLSSLDWQPNVDGFLWFYEKVFPLVLRQEPGLDVMIVGKGCSPRLKQLKHPNIRFVGFVEDVVPYIQAAQVCIVPLFAAGGMRIKILEMFAHRKCVVSTTVGCEGIEVENGQELLVADEATEFARNLISVLRNHDLRTSLGNNARRLVENKYAWHQIGAAFESVYNEVKRLK